VQSGMLPACKEKNEVALQRAEMRMVRWMCDIKVKELRESLGLADNLGTAAEQVAMIWAYVVKRSQ